MDLFQSLPLKDPDGLQLSLPLGEHPLGAQVPRGGSRGKPPPRFFPGPQQQHGPPTLYPRWGLGLFSLHQAWDGPQGPTSLP